MKKIGYLGLILFSFIMSIEVVYAEIGNGNELGGNNGIICNIGTTNGLLYSNEWNFTVADPTKYLPETVPGIDNKKRIYTFTYTMNQMCSSTDCDRYFTGQSIGNVDNLASDSNFANLATDDSMYTTEQLIESLNKDKCPKYIYVASNSAEKKIGFIFSDKQISDAKTIFENAGYDVLFEQDGGQKLDDLNIQNFQKQIEKMKERIQEYKDNNWENVYDEKCFGLTYFGGMHIDENITLQQYDKLKLKLPSDYKISDEDKSVYNEYKNIKCAEKENNKNETNKEESTGGVKDDVKLYTTVTCGSIELPDGLVKLISTFITILQIAVPLILIVMGMIDFAKATAASNEEGIKKAQQAFVRRLIAGACVFLVILVVKITVKTLNTDDSSEALVCIDKILNYKTNSEKTKEIADKTSDECQALYESGGNWKQCICNLAVTVYSSSQEFKESGELLDSEIPDQIKNNTKFKEEFEKYSTAKTNDCKSVVTK